MRRPALTAVCAVSLVCTLAVGAAGVGSSRLAAAPDPGPKCASPTMSVGPNNTQLFVRCTVPNVTETATATATETVTVTATETVTVDPTPTDTSTPTPTGTPSPGSLSLAGPEGGLDYYGQFTNGLPTTKDFFPIGVWGAYGQDPENLDLDAAAGINTYVWAADSGYLTAIRDDGRFHVIQDVSNDPGSVGSETQGWLLTDEPDMISPDGSCPNDLNAARISDGRMEMVNFGKGLALPPKDAPESETGSFNWWSDTAEADCYANAVDVASVDMYWFTDPFDGVGNRYGYLYGENVKNLRRAALSDGQAQPLWNFIETGWPFSETTAEGGRAIQPDELRSAAWHSIIAGARGILWFVHSFGGPNVGDHNTLRSNSEGTRPMVTSVDAQITSLAPVLNSDTVTDGYTKTGDVEVMVKWDGSNFYVFAGARRGATTMEFSLPCVGDATATRLGESGSSTVTGGTFTDDFADKNAVHIYRIDGGARCGL